MVGLGAPMYGVPLGKIGEVIPSFKCCIAYHVLPIYTNFYVLHANFNVSNWMTIFVRCAKTLACYTSILSCYVNFDTCYMIIDVMYVEIWVVASQFIFVIKWFPFFVVSAQQIYVVSRFFCRSSFSLTQHSEKLSSLAVACGPFIPQDLKLQDT